MTSSYREEEFPLLVGGTTGLDHESSARIDQAAAWLTSRPPHHRPHPIVPELRKLFDLTAKEACAAIREANIRHARST